MVCKSIVAVFFGNRYQHLKFEMITVVDNNPEQSQLKMSIVAVCVIAEIFWWQVSVKAVGKYVFAYSSHVTVWTIYRWLIHVLLVCKLIYCSFDFIMRKYIGISGFINIPIGLINVIFIDESRFYLIFYLRQHMNIVLLVLGFISCKGGRIMIWVSVIICDLYTYLLSI